MTSRVVAISDLHIGHKSNWEALTHLEPSKEDWLILGGDLGETVEHLHRILDLVKDKYKEIFWVPGNHELWTASDGQRGEEKYRTLVELCRTYQVHTPEDPYIEWRNGDETYVLVPMFLLYDYSFAPDEIPPEEAVAWAREAGIACSDEMRLHPDPFSSRTEWCRYRCAYTERRLAEINQDYKTILINHFPLRRDLVRLFRIPRFVPWCGTRRTEDWHIRFRAAVVVSGHLHMRATDWRDGVRFEEVALGYPRHWDQTKTVNDYVRQILPEPSSWRSENINKDHGGPIWHR
jgi:predicted phosphodiesterase